MTKKERVTIYLEPETAKELRIKAAEKGGQSAMSNLAQKYISEGLKKEPK